MAAHRVLVGSRSFGKVDRGPIDRLESFGCDVLFNEVGRAYTEAEILDRVGDVDAIITGTDAVTASVIRAAKRLKVISKHGIGTENIDLEAAREKGVVVAATPGVMDDSVADHTLALVLALARRLVAAHLDTAAGGWRPRYGMELSGKTAGIVGLGRIGKKVAVRLQAFGVRVAAHDPYPDVEFGKAHGIEWASLEDLLAVSDIVCLHAPGGGQLIGARELALVKPGALLVNTSRGALVDEEALHEALQSGRLSGAGLDVFRREPPGDSPLLQLDNVIVTPHQAGLTGEALRRMGEMAAENVIRVLAGDRPLFEVK